VDFREYVRAHLPPLTIAREPEIIDELAQHLADLYREGRATGLDHDAALARAAAAIPQEPHTLAREIETASRALPGLIADRWRASLDESAVTSRRSSMLSDCGRDIRYAIRMLLRAPGFAFVVVLTLALGIGANTVIFSAIDAVLLREAPVADPDRVALVYTSSGNQPYSTSSYPDFLDLRDSGTFQSLAAYASIALALDANNQTDSLAGEAVSGDYFDVLGVRIPIGRGFAPDEDRPGAPERVVVISHALWQRVFNGNPSIVGQPIRLNGNPYTLIGVAPRGFTGPILGRAPDAWVPMALQPEVRPPSAGLRRSLGHSRLLEVRGLRWLEIVGRLPAGGSVAQAVSGAEVVSTRLQAAYPGSNRDRKYTVVSLDDAPGVRTSTRPMLRLLGGAVLLVLLIACANVASLLLARAVSRRREVAVRVAVGAGRARLVRQWLAESLLLAVLGSIGALLIAWWSTPILYTFGIPQSVALSVNPRVLGFTLVVAVGSGLLFGLAPVVQTLRRDTIMALRDEGGAVATGARAARMRSTFVVVQVALSLVLLVGAGLFLRTLKNAYSVDLGYPVNQTLVAYINLDVRGYSQEAGLAAYEQILSRIEAIPGVVAAGAARITVLSGGSRLTAISTDGRPPQQDGSNSIDVRVNVVSHRYLDAMNIPVVRGRSFAPLDRAGTPRVAIVSESLARRLWPDADPIGKALGGGNDGGRAFGGNALQVIGVVPDTVYRSALERDPPPFFYNLLAQNYESGVALHVRAAGDPMSLVPSIREAVRQIDSQLVVARPQLLRDVLDQSLSRERMMGTLVGFFGAIALILAIVGLYGVMAHLAGQRTTEIGIRLAMGAPPSSILTLLLGQGLRLVAIGSVLGLAGAFAGTRYLETQLFGIDPTDPLTFAGVCVVLAVAGLAACAIPARRAMRVDPVIALRQA
jgi:predicted permease